MYFIHPGHFHRLPSILKYLLPRTPSLDSEDPFVVTILALFFGPVVAVSLTELLRERKQIGERRNSVFRTLMATRNATLAPEHVKALNVVEVLFHTENKQDKKVLDAWRLYLAHLNDHQYPAESWPVRRAELLIDLLYEMGLALGYSFDKSHIKSGAYYPGGYFEAETEHTEARKLWLEVLRGQRQLPMRAEVFATQAPPAPSQNPPAPQLKKP